MRKMVVILLALGLLLFSASLASAQDANEWSQYQKDKANTGFMSVTVPDEGIVSSKTSAIEARDGSEPVVAGSRVYVYTGVDDTSGSIVCLDLATGEKAWETVVDPPTLGSWSSPEVSGGLVYIGSGSKAFALNALDGSKVWEKDLGSGAAVVNSSPTIDGDRLFIGDWNTNDQGRYLCLDAKNGDIIWEFALGADCHAQSTPAVNGNRVFVGQFSAQFGVTNGKVWCLDRDNGKPVSNWGTNGYFTPEDNLDVTGSISVFEDYIYFTDFTFGAADKPNSHLYCLNKETGSQSWRTDVFPSSGAPAVGADMVVSAGNQWGVWPEPSTNWTTAFAAKPGAGGSPDQDLGEEGRWRLQHVGLRRRWKGAGRQL